MTKPMQTTDILDMSQAIINKVIDQWLKERYPEMED